MARKASFNDIEGFQALDQNLIAERMVPLSVEPKPGKWNADTKTNEQKQNAEGILQWLIQTLFCPVDGDEVHKPEVVAVSITAKAKPVLRVGATVNFIGFGAWNYISRERETRRILGVGRSFMAESFRQNGGD